ncbi:MAG TPA: adenylyltransferase/cytidyltransferase family protein [Dehalococcoidia bacterium]|nr:adenylyltransferase/cytidyltransferase family protein [Dehalococcoidia bacterium]
MTAMKHRHGMVHGRFQPFHLGHLAYLQAALQRCDTLIVAITNPDPSAVREEAEASHRHRDDANPYTFFQRQMMVREALLDEGVDLRRVVFTPFPINFPERWQYYLPPDTVQFIRVFSDWERKKVERFRGAGYTVEVLHPGAEKEVEATDVRALMASGGDWRALVPAAVARVIDRIAAGEL